MARQRADENAQQRQQNRTSQAGAVAQTARMKSGNPKYAP
jgi:hypothetical protein